MQTEQIPGGAGVKELETDTIAVSVSPDRGHLKAHKDRRLPCDCRVLRMELRMHSIQRAR